ncbi:MAG TPA: long-chain fatty acid--CoA ligase [Syntrophales bacterium]|nr:long-chain fatty acid--CoA ligase [Syntrophales bacterium]
MVFKNFNQVLLDNFPRHEKDPALMFKSAGRYKTISYGKLRDVCFRVASALMKRGLKRGDRIAIFSQNRMEWAEADAGALLAGAITSAIYSSSLPGEAAFIIRDLEASFLFVEDRIQLEKILAIRESIPNVKGVFVFSEPFSTNDPWVSPLSVLLKDEPSPDAISRIHELAEQINRDDPMCIIYTSGTTGNPKGVVLTHNNYLATLDILIEHVGDISGLKRNISFLPLAHAMERFGGYYLMLYTGGCIAYAETLETIVENFREVKPHFFIGVPRIFEKVHAKIMQSVRSASSIRKAIFSWALNVGKKAGQRKMHGQRLPWHLKPRHRLAHALLFKKVKGIFGGELVFCVSGGAPLNKEVAEFFGAMDILILEGWGATEATTPSTLNAPHDYRFGSVGKPLPRVEVRLAEDGELEVRGPNIFKEYWRNPKETEATITADGFYRSGDVGEIDKEGRVTITDRKKELIITSGGKNIASAPIINLLTSGKYIEMAYVHGDRRNYLTALLTLDQNAVRAMAEHKGVKFSSWKELVKHSLVVERIKRDVERANAELPRYMQIKYYHILEAPFSTEGGEMTPTMKLKKRVIEKKYKDIFDNMYKDEV